MKSKHIFKRSLSLLMCIVFLMSCWVFTAPSADAANENYSYNVSISTTNSADCNDSDTKPSLKLYGCDVNGTSGNPTLMQSKSLDYDDIQKENTFGFSGSSVCFPTYLELTVVFDGWGSRKWEGELTLTVNGRTIINGTSYSSDSDGFHFSANEATITMTVPTSQYPKPTTCAFTVNPASNITVPKGFEVISTAYEAKLYDQYNVAWFEAPSYRFTDSSFLTGINLGTNIIEVDSSANSSDGKDRTIVLEASYSTSIKATASITITNASYTYSFLNVNGDEITSGTAKYGTKLTAPGDPQKERTETHHYSFTGWQPTVGRLTDDTVFRPQFEEKEHVLRYESNGDATCDHDGTLTAVCTCGFTRTKQDVGSQLTHNPVFVSQTQANCTEPGIKTTQCSLCQKVFTVETPALGHDYQNPTVVAPTCTKTGYTYETCTRCQDIKTYNETEMVPHIWDDGKVTTEPTCENEGVYTYTCINCPQTKSKPIATVDHEVAIWTYDAFVYCDSDGFRHGYCTMCHKSIEEVLPQLGHDWNDWVYEGTVDCTHSAVRHRTCNRANCKNPYEEQEIEALGHLPVVRSKAPTDGRNGYLYYECGRENCSYCAKAVINAQGVLEEGAECTLSEISASTTAAVPATKFNTYNRTDSNYNYVDRKASLRISKNDPQDLQAMRFSASMLIPEGAIIIDYGYVYTQSDLYDANYFCIGDKDVVDVSLADGNYSTFKTAQGEIRTYNLVIMIHQNDWMTEYVARPYFKYCFAGQEFTVYDRKVSKRSVGYIAEQIVANPNESVWTRKFVENKIIAKLPNV